MRIKPKEFDASAYLDNDDVIAGYLTAALEDGNPDVFLSAVGNVAEAVIRLANLGGLVKKGEVYGLEQAVEEYEHHS